MLGISITKMMNIVTETDSYTLLEYNCHQLTNNTKIAGFDLDYTLIVTRSGKIFSENIEDWQFKYFNIKKKFEELINNEYRIVIISNQLGVVKGKMKKEILYQKALSISKILKVNITWIFSYQDDLYRKPRIKTFDLLGTIDKSNSFYCGDACGRQNDFSNTDYKFAKNLNIIFYSDTYFFDEINDIITYRIPEHPIKYTNTNLDIKSLIQNKTNERDIVLLIGSPASGKSTICNLYFNNYVIISQDKLKTLAKCKREAIRILVNTNKNIIIDNTNRDIKTRKEWIDIFAGYTIRFIYICIPVELVLHINNYRSLTSDKKTPKVAIFTFYKNLEQPTISEHNNIIIIPFILNQNLVDMDIFKLYLE